mgnify:CR=1 FL=1
MFYNPFVGNSRTQFMQPQNQFTQPQQQQYDFSGWNDRLTKIEEGIASLTDQFKNFQNPGNEPLPITGPSIRQPGDMGKYVADNDPSLRGGGPSLFPFPGMNSTEVSTVDMRDKTLPTLQFPEGTGPLQPSDPANPTGDALVKQIQGRMLQQDVKPPAWNAYAKDVMDTGGYPTKTMQEYNTLFPNNLLTQHPLQEGIMGLANYQSQQNTGPGI